MGPTERVPRYLFGVVVADTCGRHIESINICAEQASRKFIDLRLCEDTTCATCKTIGTLLENCNVKEVLE
jgi:hypothetical protein